MNIMIGIIQQQNPLALEIQFQMNLLRLAGKTQIVTLENIFETISYASQNGISDLLFLEEDYLPHLFGDEAFMAYICSFPSLVQRFEEAKNKNDPVVLEAFRIAHRKARLFLDDAEIKAKLKNICSFRASVNQYQAYVNMIQVMLNYTQDYVFHTPAIEIIQGVFPQLAQNVPRIQNAPPTDT
jgi:hypothetical protein